MIVSWFRMRRYSSVVIDFSNKDDQASERAAVCALVRYAKAQLVKLKKTNVLNDVFSI